MNNLLFNVENEIGVITINRPKALNALNSETLSELKQLVGEIEECKDIKAVIVTGSGEKAFVEGADIAEMVNGTPAEGRQMCLLAHKAFAKLENIPQVTQSQRLMATLQGEAMNYLWPAIFALRLIMQSLLSQR